MKKLLIILVLMLACSGIKSLAGSDDLCYVKAGDKVYIAKDLKIGLIHTRVLLTDGSVAIVHNTDITAYRHHSKQYMLLPVICEKNDTLCFAMMKYITSKSGLNLFQYCCPQNDDVFFEYKDGKFYRRVEAKNAKNELAFFDIKVR